MAEGPQLNDLRRTTDADTQLIIEFLQAVPESDRVFFKEEVDGDTVRRWARDDRARRWLLVGTDGAPRAYLAVVPGVGWAAHVGELRLLVGAAYRRRGLGRALAQRGLLEALSLGLRKVTVEVVADKTADLEMFTSIGFEVEALLKGQIMARDGTVRDLAVLAHDVDAVHSDLVMLGVENALGMGGVA